MPKRERVTGPLLDVLEVLVEATDSNVELHGWAIMTRIKRSGPTVYGVLDRLEDAHRVTSRWENSPEPGKPRRRLYSLTPTGLVEARDLLAARRPSESRLDARLRPRPTFNAIEGGIA